MKALVLWQLDLALSRPEAIRAVMRMPEYTEAVRSKGKLVDRYHVVGKHGGAWIYDVDSSEELERLLATSPVYNYATYDIYLLADMEAPTDILQEQPGS